MNEAQTGCLDKLEPEIRQRINQWLGAGYDEETRKSISKLLLEDQAQELTDAFYRDLEFGTGGLRGLIGAGTNRVNKYTIGAATQGLANYLVKSFPNETVKVAIAHDNRNFADVFARIVADVFTANNIQVYFFESLRPTPELSFAIRNYNCHSGVMLTASHNPKEYSGYKVYWNNGGQVVAPHDKNIIAEVNSIDSISKIRFQGNEKLITFLGAETDKKYIDTITTQLLNPQSVEEANDLKIVYSPIHGTGVRIVPEALKAAGFTNVYLVEEQCVVDGNFPTVIYPNPEEEEAMTMALNKGREVNADLVMATDPDADRVGIAVKDNEGNYQLLNGNQTATLIFHYLLSNHKEKGSLQGNEYIVKTIVTSGLIDKIAEKSGVKCYNVLTGFKYIGELITSLEGKEKFLAGAEESYGYLIGDHVRDKDAVVSCLIIAEMAAFYKTRNKSLYQVLADVYTEYGFYLESLISITKKGREGAEEIRSMMASLRKETPAGFAGHKVVKVIDYQEGLSKTPGSNESEPTGLPKSNVLQFITENGFVISARPSGTEPKIKFYLSVNGTLNHPGEYPEVEKDLKGKLAELSSELDQLLQNKN